MKACRLNGECLLNISVSNSPNYSWCLKSKEKCFVGTFDNTKWQYINILG